MVATVDGRRWATSVWRDKKHGTLLPVPAKIRGAKQGDDVVSMILEPRGTFAVEPHPARRTAPRRAKRR